MDAIKGTLIGCEGYAGKEKEKAFDGDWLTFYSSGNNPPWIGFDFKKKVRIEKVRCVPRSDDNNIRYGDKYELKYWGKVGWISLGIKIASDNYLIYDNVPAKTLLWLSNLTRGKEERIFTYENGKQIWW